MHLKDKIINIYELHKSMNIYGPYYDKAKSNIKLALKYYVKKNYKIAIWGAGLKGKAFLKVIDPGCRFIQYVYDKDKNKFGKTMPTGHCIVDYMNKRTQDVDVVLLMNSNHETETASRLGEHNINVIFINIDSIITGEFDARRIVSEHKRGLGL